MTISEEVLKEIRDRCMEYYSEEASHIRSIILYGGATRNFSGETHAPGDIDRNIFFSEQSSVSSTYGMPKIIGEYRELEVEVMRNKVPDDMSIEQYVKAQSSKRWERIRSEPIVQIYPDIEQIDWS